MNEFKKVSIEIIVYSQNDSSHRYFIEVGIGENEKIQDVYQMALKHAEKIVGLSK